MHVPNDADLDASQRAPKAAIGRGTYQYLEDRLVPPIVEVVVVCLERKQPLEATIVFRLRWIDGDSLTKFRSTL